MRDPFAHLFPATTAVDIPREVAAMREQEAREVAAAAMSDADYQRIFGPLDGPG